MMTNAEDSNFELRAIKRTLGIAYHEKIDEYLNKIIKTANRKKMWMAIDGYRKQNDIAKEVNVSQMAVSKFLKVVSDARLVEYVKGDPPRKLVDHVPADWINIIDKDENTS